MDDVFGNEIIPKFADVDPKAVDLGKLGFTDAGDKEVKLGIVIREVSGDLTAYEGIRKMGNLEGTFNTVVI